MSDGQGGGVAEALAGAAGAGGEGGGADGQQGGGTGGSEGGGGADGQQGGGDGGGAASRWQDVLLPEEMRGNAALANFKDVGSLAKSFVEQQQWARGRVAVPGKDATDEQWGDFVGKIKPATADEYDIPVPDGVASDMADWARGTFHEMGLHPRHAKGVAEAFNQKTADDLSKLSQGNRDALMAIQLELGEAGYNQRLTAVDNMMRALGHADYSALDALEASFSLDKETGRAAPGAGKAMQLLFDLAERTGELAKVDGAQVSLSMGRLTAAQASAKLDEMQADKAMREKYSNPGTPEHKLYNELIARVAKGD